MGEPCKHYKFNSHRRSHIYDSTYMKYPEQVNLQRQKVMDGLQGMMGVQNTELLLNGYGVFFGDVKSSWW